jgi:thiamine pyrophosphate-dependent acetolactate synthase large subunit-like protein
LITGDVGLMFNLQELQSTVTQNLNLKIINYENGGYLTMKHMQAGLSRGLSQLMVQRLFHQHNLMIFFSLNTIRMDNFLGLKQ